MLCNTVYNNVKKSPWSRKVQLLGQQKRGGKQTLKKYYLGLLAAHSARGMFLPRHTLLKSNKHLFPSAKLL